MSKVRPGPVTLKVPGLFGVGEQYVTFTARANPTDRTVVLVATSNVLNLSEGIMPIQAREFALLLNQAADLAEGKSQ